MIGTSALRNQIANLLANDPDSLAPEEDAMKVALVQTPFAANEDIVVGELDLADFDGSTPKLVVVGGQGNGTDPLTGDSVIQLLPPAGGFRFQTTGATNLPQTIHGFIVTNEAGNTIWACDLLPEPVTLTAGGQEISLGDLTIRMPKGLIR